MRVSNLVCIAGVFPDCFMNEGSVLATLGGYCLRAMIGGPELFGS